MTHLTRDLSHNIKMTVLGLAAILSAVFIAPSASAEEGRSSSRNESTKIEVETETRQTTTVEDKLNETKNQTEAESDRTAKERRTEAERLRKEQRDAAKEKLSATKLQVCNDRKANIEKRVARISERVSRQLALFDRIAEQAQAFYVAKGNTLDNYELLVADVETKATDAKSVADSLRDQQTKFDCEAAEPKAVITDYKATLTDTIAALKEYRTAVKNLIIGIKSVNATSDAAAEGAQ